MMPGLLAMFSHKGWMVLLWGITLLPLGFAILAVALFKTGAFPAGRAPASSPGCCSWRSPTAPRSST